MKNFSKKKTVLSAISLTSALTLLLCLLFNVTSIDVYRVKYGATGFDMLAFSFPKAFEAFVIMVFYEYDYKALEIFSGITSLITLLFSVLALTLTIITFFRASNEKSQRLGFVLTIISVAISFLHAIVSIIINIIFNKWLKDLGSAIPVKFSTVAYLSLIFQVIFLVAYIITSKKMRTVKDSSVTESPVNKNNNQTNSKLSIEKFNISELVTEYNSLHTEQVISSSEYTDKKSKLLKFFINQLNTVSVLVRNMSFDDTVKLENQVIGLLKEFNKLYKDEILSGPDYLDIKSALLNCII